MKIAVPNKGRLSEATLDLFRKAGLKVESSPDRKLYAVASYGRDLSAAAAADATALDRTVQILFVRAQDIPEFVQDGVAHLGVTGEDILQETRRDVRQLLDLRFGYCRLVVAVPEQSAIHDAKDIANGARIATSFPQSALRFFDGLGKKVTVVEVSGATEITPHIGVADAIVDLTSSGSTLAMNGLREIGTIVHSTARIVGNPRALDDPALHKQIHPILASLESVIKARGKRYLMANVPRERLDEVRRILPGISGPTVMDILSHPETVAAHAVVDEDALFEVVTRLKAIGATGILVLPIERLVP
ncbi:MAG TPA: ATP phosphoribosyltransferase [Candidatus Thermoplasmatota archaeon]|nr:ATP phosphoribosyltransferase [Candidatus Thermoplasmatota archaeon]